MPKAQEFKDELGVKLSPRVYRRGYLFKEIGPDSNGNVSSFHDVKTMYNAVFDHDSLAIFSDLHYSDWDHTYGGDFGFNTVLPDDSAFGTEKWTVSTPSGSQTTYSLIDPINSAEGTGVRGVLQIGPCTTSQTIAFTKTGIISNNSASTGNFTVEWKMKKTGGESNNGNEFTVQVKMGQFYIQVRMGCTTVILTETGASSVSTTVNLRNTVNGNSTGEYATFRLIIDKQRSTDKAVLLLDGQKIASKTQETTNGSASDNEIKFGYLINPAATSKTFLAYLRYHNSAFYPLEKFTVNTPVMGQLQDTGGIPSSSVWTLASGSLTTHTTEAYGVPTLHDKLQWLIINDTATDTTFRRTSDFSSNAHGNAFEIEVGTTGAGGSNIGRLNIEFDDGTISSVLDIFPAGNTSLSNGIKFNNVTVSGVTTVQNATTGEMNKYRVVQKGTGAGGAINCWLYVNGTLVASQSNTTATSSNKLDLTFRTSNGGSSVGYRMRAIKLFNYPAHVTRKVNQAYVASLDLTSSSYSIDYRSNVIVNSFDQDVGFQAIKSSIASSAITVSGNNITFTGQDFTNAGILPNDILQLNDPTPSSGPGTFRQFVISSVTLPNVLTLISKNPEGFGNLIASTCTGIVIRSPMKQLATLRTFTKDISWGDCGFVPLGNVQYRGLDLNYTPSSSSPPTFASITVPNLRLKRDALTRYDHRYSQIRVTFTTPSQELTFMRFHRQLDVTDYVTSYGTSTFERDFISRKINAGDLRVQLMNCDGDFDLFRTRPDIWTNAIWETWIGAHTDFGDFEYPDFIGTIDDMVYQSNPPYVTLEITNIIKAMRESVISPPLRSPPFNTIKVYAGNSCLRRTATQDSQNTKLFTLDSKYPVILSAVYIDDVLLANGGFANYVPLRDAPGGVVFTNTPSGTVTIDIIPDTQYNVSNGGTLIRNILQRDSKLLLNYDIDDVSLATFETAVAGAPTVSNVELGKGISDTQDFTFDFLENLITQTSGTIFIHPDDQTCIGFDLISDPKTDSETISDRNLSPSIHSCTTLTISNPIENVINTVDLTFNTGFLTDTYTYENTRLVSDYDATSPVSTSKVTSIFGVKGPSRKSLLNTNSFFNIATDYEYITSSIDMNTITDRNFAIYGYRPPIYELNEVHTNIFIYSFRDVLFLARDSATSADDTIEITRIQKDYDNLTGSIQGFSNKFIQFPGGTGLIRTFAADSTICTNSPTTDPCLIVGRTINDLTPVSGSVYLAVDTVGDTQQSFAST